MKFKPRTINRQIIKKVTVLPKQYNGITVGITKRAMEKTKAAGDTGRNAFQECVRVAMLTGDCLYPLDERISIRGYKIGPDSCLIYCLDERV